MVGILCISQGGDSRALVFQRQELSSARSKVRTQLLRAPQRPKLTVSISAIACRAEAQWQALPLHLRLDGRLIECKRGPFDCDFLLSARLNHLHVQFLLQFVLLENLTSPTEEMVRISEQMLNLVADAVLFRDNLANSGTGLTWKVTDQRYINAVKR